jgi:dihydroneopterin triphosphate diphosphatase
MTRLPIEVFIVVRRGDEFLVVHRVPSGGAYWHGIAGGVEEGETPAEAAARELLEETGFAARPVAVAGGFRYRLDREIEVHTFLVDVPAGWEPVLDGEHDDYRWCSQTDAVALLHWPEPKELLASI